MCRSFQCCHVHILFLEVWSDLMGHFGGDGADISPHVILSTMCYPSRVWVDLASECSASPHERGLYAVGSQNYLLIKLYLGWTNFCLFSEWGGLALPCWDKSERHQSNLTELAVRHLWKQPATCCQVSEEKFRAVDGLSLLCDKLGDLSANFCFFLLSVNEYIVPCLID